MPLSRHSSTLMHIERIKVQLRITFSRVTVEIINAHERGSVNRDESAFVLKKLAASNGRSHFRSTIRENTKRRAFQIFAESRSMLSRERGEVRGERDATAAETEHFRRRAEFTSLTYSRLVVDGFRSRQ